MDPKNSYFVTETFVVTLSSFTASIHFPAEFYQKYLLVRSKPDTGAQGAPCGSRGPGSLGARVACMVSFEF